MWPRIKISLHLRRAGERVDRARGEDHRATGVLISALFPKGEPRQPGTRQITFPPFCAIPPALYWVSKLSN